jgi:hypothetical protein
VSPYNAVHRLSPYYIQQALSLIERPVKNGFMVCAGSLQVEMNGSTEWELLKQKPMGLYPMMV